MLNYAVLALLVASMPRDDFPGTKPGDERRAAGIKLCWCPPGRFTMGSPAGEPERRPGEDQVDVRLTRGFWIGKFELTQGDWRRIAGDLPGKPTAELPEGDDLPVGNVNFAQAEEFCRKLTEEARKSGELPADWEFRLPTEAQWEYACRAGTTTATAFGDRLGGEDANMDGTMPLGGAKVGPFLKETTPAGRYRANAWGLLDMHGNVWEWCDDDGVARVGRAGEPEHAARGGCWHNPGSLCRSDSSMSSKATARGSGLGFRVALAPARSE